MKQTLELRHLAPYLPYRLRLIKKNDWHKQDWDDHRVVIMDQLVDRPGSGWFYIGGVYEDQPNASACYESDQFKPLLHPLDRLTQEISVDGYNEGKLFVPLNELGLDEFKSNMSHPVRQDNVWYSLDLLSYRRVCMMHKWHFDTEGLIEKGLALPIDLTTNK